MTRTDPLITGARIDGITKSAAGPHRTDNACKACLRSDQGFKPFVTFHYGEAFRKNPERIADEEWKELNPDSREVLEAELGHGKDRRQILDIYFIGSTDANFENLCW